MSDQISLDEMLIEREQMIAAAFKAHIAGIGRTPLKVDVMENLGNDWPMALGFRCGSDDGKTEPIIVSDNVSGLSLETGSAQEIAEALVAASNIMPVLHDELSTLRARAEAAEARAAELEAFRAQVAGLTLQGEGTGDLCPADPLDHAEPHEALEALIRKARGLSALTVEGREP